MAPEVLSRSPEGASSDEVAQRVVAARARQRARQGRLNAELEGAALDQHATAEPAAQAFLQSACARLGWSGRAYHRVLKLARTIADLAEADHITSAHMAEAIQYRRALSST